MSTAICVINDRYYNVQNTKLYLVNNNSSVLPEYLVTECLNIPSKQTIKSAQQTAMTYIYFQYGKIVIIFRSNIIIISQPSLRYYFDHYGGMSNSQA